MTERDATFLYLMSDTFSNFYFHVWIFYPKTILFLISLFKKQAEERH